MLMITIMIETIERKAWNINNLKELTRGSNNVAKSKHGLLISGAELFFYQTIEYNKKGGTKFRNDIKNIESRRFWKQWRNHIKVKIPEHGIGISPSIGCSNKAKVFAFRGAHHMLFAHVA